MAPFLPALLPALLAAVMASPAWGQAEPQPAPPTHGCPPEVLPQRSAGPARDRGMLWRLQRDGRTSYLYGTLHVGRPEWQRPGPRVAAALAATDTLALEVDVDDPALMKQLSDAALAAMNTAAAGSAERAAVAPLSPALQQRLADAARRSCLPLVTLAGQPPLMQAASVKLRDARWLGLDPSFGLDRALAAHARGRGRGIVSLETLAQQTAAMQPDRAEETEAQVDQALRQLDNGSARRSLARLADTWERGDLAQLARYEAWCECAPSDADREQLKRLNDRRNPNLAAGIVAEHARGRRVFAAVGALHMTGPAALPRLLEAEGFRVQRVELRLRPVRRPASPLGSSR